MTKPQPTAAWKPRPLGQGDPLANVTPEEWKQAIAAKELRELEEGARTGWKPAIEELARRKAATQA